MRLCAFEPGAGQAAAARAETGALPVEQLPGIFTTGGAASGLDAHGPIAGRDGHSQRRRGGAKAV